MSEFRFRIPKDWKLSSYHISSIFVVGNDGVPWPCKVKIDSKEVASPCGSILHIARNQNGSGRLYCIYPLRDRGEMLLCTGTLPECGESYDLIKELARGTINRLRNQVSIWCEGGLEIDDSIKDTVSHSVDLLGRAVMCNDRLEQDRLAAECIETGIAGIFDLSLAFGSQISKFRREHQELGAIWLANTAANGEQFEASSRHECFELVQVKSEIGSIRSLHELDKQVILGPWLNASAGGMSPSLLAVEGHRKRRNLLLKDCRKQLEALPSSASLIHVVSGLNGIGHRHLNYPQQLQITAELLNLVDDAMIELPTMISFDFPWAERLASAVGGIHPMQIADSLLRQGLGISYLGLEINLDYWPNGSVIRDPLQWIDLVDIWAQLNLPLILCLRVPSGDVSASPGKTKDRMANRKRSNVTEKQRQDLLNTVLPMMVARPSVQGILWQQWQDGDDTRFPGGGIVDNKGESKPVLAVLEQLRKSMVG